MNPRSPLKGDTRLAGEPLRPLGHLSVLNPYFKPMYLAFCNGALNHVRFRACHAPYVVHGGGSRIRTHVPDLREAVFKTAALSHSAIPPRSHRSHRGEILSTIHSLLTIPYSFPLFYPFNPVHIMPKDLWNDHTAIGLLIIFEDRYQCPSNSQTRPIERMDIFCFRFP